MYSAIGVDPTKLTAITPAIKHLHIPPDYLSAIALLAVLLPGAGSKGTLDVHLGALLQVLRGNFRQPRKTDDVVPLRVFLLLVSLTVTPAVAGGHAELSDRAAALGIPGFRVSAQVTDENDFVDPPRHDALAELSMNKRSV